MLSDFILANREAIIAGIRARVALRTSPRPTEVELTNGIPIFLDQLGAALRRATATDVPEHAELMTTAGHHGQDLFAMGLTIGQVVHEDECGGLPPGKSEDLFESFAQRAHDPSGLGLGLSICRRAAQVCAGEVYVRDLPGKGCIFTLDLPRKPPPPLSIVGGKRGESSPAAGAESSHASGPDAPKAQLLAYTSPR